MLFSLSNVSYSHPPSIPTVCPHLKRVARRYLRRTAGGRAGLSAGVV